MNGVLPYALAGIVLYALLYFGGVLWVARRSRSGRVPFAQNEKLLRRPGQHLEERLEGLDEAVMDKVILGFAGPPMLCLLLATGLPFVGRDSVLVVLGLILLVGAVSFIVRLRAIDGVIRERRNTQLGLDGERYVADILRPLNSKGYFLFHDVPAEGRSGRFNLDHIVVGPSGVFVIETKTRRKDQRNEAGEDHVIVFENNQIHWPGGFRDCDALKQTQDAADWLRQELAKRLAIEDIPVNAYLTFPGWWVDRKGHGPVVVCNPKELLGAVQGKTIMAPHRVRQIAAQLDVLCRTDSLVRSQPSPK